MVERMTVNHGIDVQFIYLPPPTSRLVMLTFNWFSSLLLLIFLQETQEGAHSVLRSPV